MAFVVTYPKVREVWAADFRDRVVHHVIYNAISDRFHRRFIRDSYACIPGRGTHDGLRRVSSFARSVTRNWTRPAYALNATSPISSTASTATSSSSAMCMRNGCAR
jgi:RNA-directed DNA polymerase